MLGLNRSLFKERGVFGLELIILHIQRGMGRKKIYVAIISKEKNGEALAVQLHYVTEIGTDLALVQESAIVSEIINNYLYYHMVKDYSLN